MEFLTLITDTKVSVDKFPEKCPKCGKAIQSSFHIAKETCFNKEKVAQRLDAIFECPDKKCGRLFLAIYKRNDGINDGIEEDFLLARMVIECPERFDECIKKISPKFGDIWNEAFRAEHHGLKDICGAGYRKALEFLIKDYLIYRSPQKETEIKNKKLDKCADELDEALKKRVKRAIWLGNDETHYMRKWEGKDLKDLKALIGSTLDWIKGVHLTSHYENEMPDKK